MELIHYLDSTGRYRPRILIAMINKKIVMKKLILTLLLPLLFISCSDDFTVLGPISERNGLTTTKHNLILKLP